MQRIVIVGSTGSGKTTLGRKLAETLGLPFTDLDDLYWRPGWVVAPEDEFISSALEKSNKNQWVIAGNYSKVRDKIWKKADTLIWLDYSFPRVFWQLFTRCIKRITDKQPICNGNYETLPQLLSKNSIMVWLFQSYWRRRREYNDYIHSGDYPALNVIRLQKPCDIADILARIEPGC